VQTVVTSILLIALGLLFCPALPAQTGPPSPSGFAALAAKANAARDGERLEEALTLYRKALAVRPGWAEGWWSLGTIQYDRNAYAEAARAFQKVTVLAPRNGTAYVMLGLAEFELGHDELALQHIQKGTNIGLDKDVGLRHVVLYHEGVLFQRKGKFEAAQETLEQLCLQGVQNDEIANALGMTLLRLTTKNPPPQGSADADIVVRIGRAECLAGQKKYDEARPGFDAVVKENPNYPNIHYAYGLFLLEARDLPAGVEQLKQEIANHPGHVFARLQIAAAQYKVDSAAGIPYAEEAVKLSPGLPFGHYLLGLLLLDADQAARAIPELEIARKTFSRDPKVYFALGSAYSRTGRKQDAARARATFERLSKEKSKSTSEQETGDTAGQKVGSPIDTPPPQ
jgi:tetratricopeptide (TPR) repeat protein